MPDYTVRVTVTWPVSAVNAEDALSTVPLVVKVKHIGTETGLTEVIDAAGQKVLTAVLNPDEGVRDEKGR